MAAKRKSWQQRLKEATDVLAAAYVQSLSVDHRLYRYDIVGSIVHAQMLSEAGLISRKEFALIKKGLLQIARDIETGRFRFDPMLEDIHMVIEDALIERIGEAGKKLHIGRSRNDQVVTDLRLWMRDRIDYGLLPQIKSLQQALLSLAERQGGLIMPGYTHQQPAQPVTVGAYVLSFVEMLHRDRQRLSQLRERVNVLPLGSGALAGSSLPLNRKRVAELLGFKQISHNSIDAVSDRDFCVEFVFVLAMVAMHLSRLSQDWINFASSESGILELPERFCTSSSMMPQKRNPDVLELVRGRTGAVYGNLTALLTMLKAQPMCYNRDLQEDKAQVFAACDTVEASLQVVTAIVSLSRFRPQRLAELLEAGFMDATAMADYLVRKAVPFRDAHGIVGRLVALAESQGKQLRELPLEQMRRQSDKFDEDVYDILGAANVARSYVTDGAAGPRQLRSQIARWRRILRS